MPEEVILEKLAGLEQLLNERFDRNNSDHDQLNSHLQRLNGQVAKNSQFRQRGIVVIGIASLIAGSALTGIIAIAITKIFNS